MVHKDYRECKTCKENLFIVNFQVTKKRKYRPSTYARECKACHSEKLKNMARDFKLKCLDYKGGRRCSICSYDKYVGALDFHHRDPSQKDFNIATSKSIPWDSVQVELDKCIVACSNCHREIHAGLTEIE